MTTKIYGASNNSSNNSSNNNPALHIHIICVTGVPHLHDHQDLRRRINPLGGRIHVLGAYELGNELGWG